MGSAEVLDVAEYGGRQVDCHTDGHGEVGAWADGRWQRLRCRDGRLRRVGRPQLLALDVSKGAARGSPGKTAPTRKNVACRSAPWTSTDLQPSFSRAPAASMRSRSIWAHPAGSCGWKRSFGSLPSNWSTQSRAIVASSACGSMSMACTTRTAAGSTGAAQSVGGLVDLRSGTRRLPPGPSRPRSQSRAAPRYRFRGGGSNHQRLDVVAFGADGQSGAEDEMAEHLEQVVTGHPDMICRRLQGLPGFGRGAGQRGVGHEQVGSPVDVPEKGMGAVEGSVRDQFKGGCSACGSERTVASVQLLQRDFSFPDEDVRKFS